MIRICVDRTCPSCGWPELIAVGDSFATGPTKIECVKCDFEEALS